MIVQICNLPNGDQTFWEVSDEQLAAMWRLQDIGALAPDIVIQEIKVCKLGK